MRDMVGRLGWVAAYAVGMALLEAVVVAYIRGMLNFANDFSVLYPYIRMEICREAATLLMLAAVGWLAGRQRTERWAFGVFAFGLWDMWYYVWLKVFIDWPDTLLDWDTLFLIPLEWRGPVLSPLLIAGLMCLGAVLALIRSTLKQEVVIKRRQTGCVVLGGLLAMYVFMAGAIEKFLREGQFGLGGSGAETFMWPLFLVALLLMAVPTIKSTWPGSWPKEQLFSYREINNETK